MEYHLIVELEAGDHEEYNQLIVVNGQCVRNIPTVNPNTCYTGKKIFVDINGQIRTANVCMISDDFEFISEHFRAIGNERAAETDANKRPEQPPQNMSSNGSRQNSPDSNLPELPVPQNVPPMTFDQQTQTDRSLFDSMVPATAAQLAQHMNTMAQIQSQNSAIQGSINELFRGQMAINSGFNLLSNSYEEILRRLRGLEESVQQLMRADRFSVTPPEESIYLQLTPEESSPSENLAINDVQMEAVEQKPILKTYKGQTSRMNKSTEASESENDENLTPNVKRMKSISPPERPEPQPCSSKQLVYCHEEDIVIGPNGTTVPAHILKSVNWACYSVATRRILVSIFGRSILATHSLSGKPSPAFLDRNPKKQLDPRKIQDIVQYVAKNANVPESNVRCVITAKCADENKMYKAGNDSTSSSSSSSEKSNKRKSFSGNSSKN